MSRRDLVKYDGPRPDKPSEAVAPDVARAGKNKRKDLKRYCKGNVKNPHVWEIATSQFFPSRCHRLEWGVQRWFCRHVRRCEKCGKIRDRGWHPGEWILADCPDWDGQPWELKPR